MFIVLNTSEIARGFELSFHINVTLNFKTIRGEYILQLKYFRYLPLTYHQGIITKSVQRYWHLRTFSDRTERENENAGSLPSASVSQGGWAHTL